MSFAHQLSYSLLILYGTTNSICRDASKLILDPSHAPLVHIRAARHFQLYIRVVCFDSVMFLFQAKGLATTIRIGKGGDNVTDVVGVGFDWNDEAIMREVGIATVEHVEIGYLFHSEPVVS